MRENIFFDGSNRQGTRSTSVDGRVLFKLGGTIPPSFYLSPGSCAPSIANQRQTLLVTAFMVQFTLIRGLTYALQFQ